MNYGKLNIHVVSDNSGFPIPDATVQITSENEPENIIEEAVTNNVGQLNDIELAAPPVDYSMTPSANKPYSEYTITISASGFESVEINGAEIFSGETAIQNASLLPLATGETDSAEVFVIPDHTLWGDYPPKIPESEIKTVEETGEIVLSRVVIPEYVVVHDGPPSDTRAKNYYVKYRDYIKNVASSEIYSTWPEATIRANILAIQSFTLNRVYTEWYRNKGKDFTITSSTAYDHKWIRGRNIFDSIDPSLPWMPKDALTAQFFYRLPDIRTFCFHRAQNDCASLPWDIFLMFPDFPVPMRPCLIFPVSPSYHNPPPPSSDAISPIVPIRPQPANFIHQKPYSIYQKLDIFLRIIYTEQYVCRIFDLFYLKKNRQA